MTASGARGGSPDWLGEAEAELRALDPRSRRPMLADQVVAAAREVAVKALKAYLAAQGEDAGEVGGLAELVARCGRHDPEFAQLAYAADVLALCAPDDPGRPCFSPTEDDAAEGLEMAAGVYRFVKDRV